jgi:transposase
LLFPENLGKQLSIDETSLSHGELYTIVTNKAAKGQKGSIVAIVAGTKAEDVIKTLWKLPEQKRNKIEEITLDLASNMQVIVKRSFPNAVRVTDRFHVQKLATEAVQDLRIKHRWEALDLENNLIERARSNKTEYKPEILKNGDTLKQLLARSRYFLYKSRDNWTESQKHRAEILFYRYPDIEIAYNLSADLRNVFNKTKDKVYALAKLAKWHEKVRQAGFKTFNTVSRTVENHYETILNYFNNRSTNASAESFKRGVAPSKIKAFRSQFRGVRNVEYYLFRLCLDFDTCFYIILSVDILAYIFVDF